jgi:hypothetical protein
MVQQITLKRFILRVTHLLSERADCGARVLVKLSRDDRDTLEDCYNQGLTPSQALGNLERY